jgi:hypothetical protein
VHSTAQEAASWSKSAFLVERQFRVFNLLICCEREAESVYGSLSEIPSDSKLYRECEGEILRQLTASHTQAHVQ